MHLDTEELLDLLHGDITPDRVDSCLDHLEDCAECSATFDLMVELRAHRHEALGALAVAGSAAKPATHPQLIPHPASKPAPTSSGIWSTGLRLAASLAVAALAGLLMWGAPIGHLSPDGPDAETRQALAELATDEFQQVSRLGPRGSDIRLTAGSAERAAIEEALTFLEEDRPGMAVARLSELSPAETKNEVVGLYLGIAYYLAGETERAIETLRPLENNDNDTIWRSAAWYEANALLRLGKTDRALTLARRLAYPEDDESSVGNFFQRQGLELETSIQTLTSTRAKAEGDR